MEEKALKAMQNALSGMSATVYPGSVNNVDGAIIGMAKDAKSKFIVALPQQNGSCASRFDGKSAGEAKICPLNEANAALLRELLPWTAPVPVLRKKISIGCGDRLGLASAGHCAALKSFQASPVLAQQSIRELTLTNRTYRNVIDDTSFLVFQAGYKDGYGADGDHLKSAEHIDMALSAGATMITLDVSEELFPAAATWSEAEVKAAYSKLPAETKAKMESEYSGKSFDIGGAAIAISPLEAMRCALIYTKALDFAAAMDKRLKGKADLEVSVDETSAPTLPEHHFFIARELLARKVDFVSLAPRFVGEFQKGIDYIGDLAEFERHLALHVAIAKHFGNYKISVHSGSDKFKAFPVIGRLTGGRFHLKTAGTSWLEAVRAIAQVRPALYRAMHAQSLKGLNDARKLYHVTSDFAKVPDISKLKDSELPALMEMNEARQLQIGRAHV